MRKKTIKPYFFNNSKRYSFTSLYFLLPKNVYFRKRLFPNIHKLYRIRRRARKVATAISLKRYHVLLRKHYLYNWRANIIKLKYNLINTPLKTSASFNRLMFFKRQKKPFGKKLFFWFFMKQLFIKRRIKEIYQFKNVPFLTTHAIRLLLRKNRRYAAWVKYKTHIFNMPCYSKYVYSCLLTLRNSTAQIEPLVHFFTANPSKRSIWVTEDFETLTSNWLQCPQAPLGRIASSSLPNVLRSYPQNPSEHSNEIFENLFKLNNRYKALLRKNFVDIGVIMPEITTEIGDQSTDVLLLVLQLSFFEKIIDVSREFFTTGLIHHTYLYNI